MAIFNSYVSLPDGMYKISSVGLVGSPFPAQPYASKVPLEAVEALGKFVSSTPSLVRWGQTGLVVIRVGLKVGFDMVPPNPWKIHENSHDCPHENCHKLGCTFCPDTPVTGVVGQISWDIPRGTSVEGCSGSGGLQELCTTGRYQVRSEAGLVTARGVCKNVGGLRRSTPNFWRKMLVERCLALA